MSRIVYGVGPVRELVGAAARTIQVLYVSPARKAKARAGDPVAAIAKAAKMRGVAVEVRSRGDLDALVGADARHQGAVAIAGDFAYADLDDVLAELAGAERPPLVVALDGVTDPHNLGAVVRSAHVLGARAVVIPEKRAAGVTPAVVKTSAGATELIPICQVTNLVRALEAMKQAGLWLVALAAGEGARSIADIDMTGPTALVAGAEGSGLRRLVLEACDHRAEIEMRAAGVGSLNVSVATAIALYEAARQRAIIARGDGAPTPSPPRAEGQGGAPTPCPRRGEGQGGAPTPSPRRGEGRGGGTSAS